MEQSRATAGKVLRLVGKTKISQYTVLRFMTLPVHLSVDQLHLDALISLIPYPIHGFSSEVFLPLYIFLESVPTK